MRTEVVASIGVYDPKACCRHALFMSQGSGHHGLGLVISDGSSFGEVRTDNPCTNLPAETPEIKNPILALGSIRREVVYKRFDLNTIFPRFLRNKGHNHTVVTCTEEIQGLENLRFSPKDMRYKFFPESLEKTKDLLSRFSKTGIWLMASADKILAFIGPESNRTVELFDLDGGYLLSTTTDSFKGLGGELIRKMTAGQLAVIDREGLIICKTDKTQTSSSRPFETVSV